MLFFGLVEAFENTFYILRVRYHYLYLYIYEQPGMVVFVGKGSHIQTYFSIIGSEFNSIGYQINNGFAHIFNIKYPKRGTEPEVGDDVYVPFIGQILRKALIYFV